MLYCTLFQFLISARSFPFQAFLMFFSFLVSMKVMGDLKLCLVIIHNHYFVVEMQY